MSESKIAQWLPRLIEGQVDAATLSRMPRLDEYRLVKFLGRGGMGCVYAAHDTVLDRPVAIKLLTTLGQSSQDRFLIEARAIARLSHPNVLSIHRVGALDEVPFLVSEYVRGESLDSLRLPLPEDEVLRVGIDLASGLRAAHRCGVLHRDIKPGNAMRTEDGTVKLLDFGLAKLSGGMPEVSPSSPPPRVADDPLARTPLADTLDWRPPANASPPAPSMARSSGAAITPRAESPAGLTYAGAQLGTPLYMAPEMWRGEAATAAVDIYSLGALLYELASGRPPHTAQTIEALYHLATETPAPPLASVAPGLDGTLAAIIDRCLQQKAEQRYPSAEALLEALEQLRDAKKERARRSSRPSWQRAWPLSAAAVAVAGLGLLVLLSAALRGHVTSLAQRLHIISPPAGPAVDSAAAIARAPKDMAFIPGRTFDMGATSEAIDAAFRDCPKFSTRCKREYFDWQQPVRRVTVRSFYLDKHEVTNQEFAAWLNLPFQQLSVLSERLVSSGGTLLCDLHPAVSRIEQQSKRFVVRAGFADHPVLQVTWYGAQQYCQAHGKTLPTEAQWELAARPANLEREAARLSWPWGESAPTCEGVTMARDPGEICAHLPRAPSAVGTSPQDLTPEGVYDLGGNAREWTLDRFLARYPDCGSCVEPVVADTPGGAADHAATFRVIRGGNYQWSPQAAHSTERTRWREDQVSIGTGFRCAMSITP